MRVNGPSPQLGVVAAKPKRTDEADGNFEVPEETTRGENKSAPRAAATSSMSSLIAAQLHGADDEEWEEQRRRRKKNFKHGEDMLDFLDGMKVDLLAGKLSPSNVVKLLHRIESRQRDSGDERLEALIDEIELRARVELAKLKKREDEASDSV